jgi:hypothetical protein
MKAAYWATDGTDLRINILDHTVNMSYQSWSSGFISHSTGHPIFLRSVVVFFDTIECGLPTNFFNFATDMKQPSWL